MVMVYVNLARLVELQRLTAEVAAAVLLIKHLLPILRGHPVARVQMRAGVLFRASRIPPVSLAMICVALFALLVGPGITATLLQPTKLFAGDWIATPLARPLKKRITVGDIERPRNIAFPCTFDFRGHARAVMLLAITIREALYSSWHASIVIDQRDASCTNGLRAPDPFRGRMLDANQGRPSRRSVIRNAVLSLANL